MSHSAKPTATLCSPRTLIAVTRTSQIVARSSPACCKTVCHNVLARVIWRTSPTRQCTAIQYIHSSSRVCSCQKTTSTHHCSVQRIGVGIKLTVRVPNSAHVRDGSMCTFIIVVCIMRIFIAFTVLFCNLLLLTSFLRVVTLQCRYCQSTSNNRSFSRPHTFTEETHVLVGCMCTFIAFMLYCVVNANSVVTCVLGLIHRRITICSAVGVSWRQPVTCCGHSPLVSQ